MSEQHTDNRVQLGCGTLIIIALIVMIFSGGQSSDTLRHSVEDLSQKVERLEKKIDMLVRKADQPPLPEAGSTNR